jgi:protein-tyrosine phosphatase
MAEGIFKEMIKKNALSANWSCDSAGTSRYHIGSQPDPRTLDVLENHGITFRHQARQVNTSDAREFDYILAMDRANYNDLKDMLPANYKGLQMIREYDPQERNGDVPDPYYGGDQGFEKVYQMLERSLISFLQHVQEVS